MGTLPRGVDRVKDPGGRDAVRVEGSGGSVLIAMLGGQVLSWQSPLGEVLWCASNAEYGKGKPVRGGIPLVFPWFNDHPTDKKLSAHGFARNLEWNLAAEQRGPGVVLEASDDAGTRAMWPHAFRLQLAVALGEDELRLVLTVHNAGSAPFRCEEALHTYFATGDVRTASVHGLEGVPFTETASAPEATWDTTAPLRFRAETDRIFDGVPDRIELRAPALARTVVLRTSNARSAIVWNPWVAKTAKLSQMAPDDWQRFCCVESANVRQRAIEVPAGGSHTLSLAIGCRRA